MKFLEEDERAVVSLGNRVMVGSAAGRQGGGAAVPRYELPCSSAASAAAVSLLFL